MVKITLLMNEEHREYKGKSGRLYEFTKGYATEVVDAQDALGFLECGDGKYFKTEGVYETIKKELKKLLGKKEVDESKPPKETGILEPKPIEEADGEVIEEPKELILKLSGLDLKALNRDKQVYLIRSIMKDQTKIPRTEKERIDLLLKLQADGNDLKALLEKYE